MPDSDYLRGYQDCMKGYSYGLNLLSDEKEYQRGWEARRKIETNLATMWERTDLTFQQFLVSQGYPDGILDPKWRALSETQKRELHHEWDVKYANNLHIL